MVLVVRRAAAGVAALGALVVFVAGCEEAKEERHAGVSLSAIPARTQGNIIAFSRVVNNRGNVFVASADDGTARQVTRLARSKNGVGASDPAWSPDGRRIVFIRETDSERFRQSQYSLYTVAVDGTRLRRLTDPRYGILFSPAWSPDGRKIAYSRWLGEGKQTIRVIDVNRPRRSMRLGEGPQEDSDPAWSPDGRRVAFKRGSDIWLMKADGSEARKLIEDGAAPAWSPDGRLIAFSSSRDGRGETCYDDGCDPNGEIYVARADGGEQRRLTRSDANDWHPTWSPDSRWIVFTAGYEGFVDRLFVMSSDGRCRRILLGRSISPSYPAWQPGRPSQANSLRCRSVG